MRSRPHVVAKQLRYLIMSGELSTIRNSFVVLFPEDVHLVDRQVLEPHLFCRTQRGVESGQVRSITRLVAPQALVKEITHPDRGTLALYLIRE
jgi:hypothetical protein